MFKHKRSQDGAANTNVHGHIDTLTRFLQSDSDSNVVACILEAKACTCGRNNDLAYRLAAGLARLGSVCGALLLAPAGARTQL